MAKSTNFIERLAELAGTKRPFAQITLVETTGSTPQDAGSKMLVDESGLVFGTIGGGKVEKKAIETAQAMMLDSKPLANRLVEWNLQRDVGMTCGGLVKIFLELYNRRDWRIVVFGAGHVAQAVIRCLQGLDCQIACIDSREDWLGKIPDSPQIEKHLLSDPAAFTDQIRPVDFVICVTMGHSTDRPILEKIFSSPEIPVFVGAIGSRSKRGVLIRELEEAGIARERTEVLQCPLGLPFGTNDPAEIAISIVAQLLDRRDAWQANNSRS